MCGRSKQARVDKFVCWDSVLPMMRMGTSRTFRTLCCLVALLTITIIYQTWSGQIQVGNVIQLRSLSEEPSETDLFIENLKLSLTERDRELLERDADRPTYQSITLRQLENRIPIKIQLNTTIAAAEEVILPSHPTESRKIQTINGVQEQIGQHVDKNVALDVNQDGNFHQDLLVEQHKYIEEELSVTSTAPVQRDEQVVHKKFDELWEDILVSHNPVLQNLQPDSLFYHMNMSTEQENAIVGVSTVEF